MAKNLLANVGDAGNGFDPWVGKIPWGRKWQLTLVYLTGESQGQRRHGVAKSWTWLSMHSRLKQMFLQSDILNRRLYFFNVLQRCFFKQVICPSRNLSWSDSLFWINFKGKVLKDIWLKDLCLSDINRFKTRMWLVYIVLSHGIVQYFLPSSGWPHSQAKFGVRTVTYGPQGTALPRWPVVSPRFSSTCLG